MRTIATTVAALAVAMSIAACGSSDGVSEGSPQPAAAAPPGDAGTSGSDSGSGSGHGQPSGGGGDAGTDTAGVTPKRVFVTSVLYTGDLGGLAGADAKCNLAARGADIGGTWIAWLSISTADALTRIGGDGPWYNKDGKTKVFNNKANLQTVPLAPIELDEWGDSAGYTAVWTGTDQGGVRGAMACADWTDGTSSQGGITGSRGLPGAPPQNWGGDAQSGTSCDAKLPLLCFEQ